MKKLVFVLLILAAFAVALVAQQITATEVAKPMKMRFEEREAFIVMGLEAQDAMGGDAMMDIWTKFFSIQDKLPEPVGNRSYGIYYPGEKYDPTTMQGHNYLVGLEVKDNIELPKDLQLHKVPGGHFAVFEYVGDINEIGKAYEYIFGEWLSSGEYKPASLEWFESYDERFKGNSKESLAEIWVPVLKLDVSPEKEPNLKQ